MGGSWDRGPIVRTSLAARALHRFSYNFITWRGTCRAPQALKAKITDHPRPFEELVGLIDRTVPQRGRRDY
jgi:hypothetical protein